MKAYGQDTLNDVVDLPKKLTNSFQRFFRHFGSVNFKAFGLAVVLLGTVAITTLAASSPVNLFTQASGEGTITYTADQLVNEDGRNYSEGPEYWFGNAESSSASFLGIHFSGDPLPAGATIRKIELKVVSPSNQWISQSTRVYVQNAQQAARFSSGDRPSQRALSADSIKYSDNKEWKSGREYALPNLRNFAPVLQSHEGSFALILKGAGNSWGRKYIFGNGGSAPKLVVTYAIDNATPAPTQQPTPQPTVSPTISPTPTTPGVSPTPTTPPIGGATPTPTPISSDPHVGHGENSHAMGQWTPTQLDTCPNPADTARIKEIHDSYYVYGPDGKKYPTWHPPVDPATGCKFGHEHGRDPSQSALMPFIREYYGCQEHGEKCGIPFGYVNEALDKYNAINGINNGMRHEDHVGHKLEWENNLPLTRNECAGRPASLGCFTAVQIGANCDFLMKPHQGTHSKDAFTNNMHELLYFVQCRGTGAYANTRVASSKMVLFGRPGAFFDGTVDQGGREIVVGTATPSNSASGNGARSIPAISKVRQHILVPNGQWSLYSNGLYEDWISSNYITTSDGRQILYYDPHFAVFSPSRFFWPGSENADGITRTAEDRANNIGRSIDVCFMTENNGSERYRGGECDQVTNYGQIRTPIPYNDPRSPFNGVNREFYFNQTSINNVGGAIYWYSDPFGRNAVAANPGSQQANDLEARGYVRHYIAPINNNLPWPLESQAIGGDRYYGGNGVHAPN